MVELGARPPPTIGTRPVQRPTPTFAPAPLQNPHPKPGSPMRNWLRKNRGFLTFLLLFGLFRTAVADWNPVPTGSMRPTIQEGDVVLVDRLAYQLKVPLTDIVVAHLGEPRRGDIVTFSSPADG